MDSQRRFMTNHGAEKGFSVHPKAFTFFDKRTGARRFEVKANADGSIPVDQAVGLLVVHCLMRKQIPNDFMMMVSAGEKLFDTLGKRAKTILLACPAAQTSVQLTRRQEEVLRGVLQSLSNKEIGVNLNISGRTVKFHVAALLEKFGVVRRISLMRMASDMLLPVRFPEVREPPHPTASEKLGTSQEPRNSRNTVVQLKTLESRSRG